MIGQFDAVVRRTKQSGAYAGAERMRPYRL